MPSYTNPFGYGEGTNWGSIAGGDPYSIQALSNSYQLGAPGAAPWTFDQAEFDRLKAKYPDMAAWGQSPVNLVQGVKKKGGEKAEDPAVRQQLYAQALANRESWENLLGDTTGDARQAKAREAWGQILQSNPAARAAMPNNLAVGPNGQVTQLQQDFVRDPTTGAARALTWGEKHNLLKPVLMSAAAMGGVAAAPAVMGAFGAGAAAGGAGAASTGSGLVSGLAQGAISGGIQGAAGSALSGQGLTGALKNAALGAAGGAAGGAVSGALGGRLGQTLGGATQGAVRNAASGGGVKGLVTGAASGALPGAVGAVQNPVARSLVNTGAGAASGALSGGGLRGTLTGAGTGFASSLVPRSVGSGQTPAAKAAQGSGMNLDFDWRGLANQATNSAINYGVQAAANKATGSSSPAAAAASAPEGVDPSWWQKYGPLIIQGAGIPVGILAGKAATSSAMERSPEEQAALAGATRAAGQIGTTANELIGESRPYLGQAGTYYSTLLRGNRAAQNQAVAPYAAQITGQYRGATRNLQQSGIRGAQRDVAQSELNRDRASKLASLVTGMQPGAAAALANLGTSGLQMGSQLLGQSGTIYGNLLRDAYLNRLYARLEGEKMGTSIGGFIRDIGEVAGKKPSGSTGNGGGSSTGGATTVQGNKPPTGGTGLPSYGPVGGGVLGPPPVTVGVDGFPGQVLPRPTPGWDYSDQYYGG